MHTQKLGYCQHPNNSSGRNNSSWWKNEWISIIIEAGIIVVAGKYQQISQIPVPICAQ